MIEKRSLDLNDARRMAESAEQLALSRGWRLSFAVVDEGGNLLLFHRMDGATLASIEIAIKKARTALAYRTATKGLEAAVAAGKLGLIGLPDTVAFEGGIPIKAGGEVVGAFGASGALGHEDGAAAQAALESF